MSGRLTKPKCLKILSQLSRGRLGLLNRARFFLDKFPFLSFLLQAPQALFTTTKWLADKYKTVPQDDRPWYVPNAGYGLILGPVMGFISEVLWADLAKAAGAPVTFRGPPPADPVGKATRYLSQMPYHMSMAHAYSKDDLALLATADAAAVAILARTSDRDILRSRAAQLHKIGAAQFAPWTESALTILIRNGYDPGVELKQPLPAGLGGTTYGTALEYIASQAPNNYLTWRDTFRGDTVGTFLDMIMAEAGEDIFTELTDDDDPIKPIFTDLELAFSRQFEFQVFPPYTPTGVHMEAALERAIAIARSSGLHQASQASLRQAFNEYFQGWKGDPPGILGT